MILSCSDGVSSNFQKTLVYNVTGEEQHDFILLYGFSKIL